jgi:hypothetical protein
MKKFELSRSKSWISILIGIFFALIGIFWYVCIEGILRPVGVAFFIIASICISRSWKGS